MRALLNWSGALAGLLLLITGGLLHPAWLQWSDTSGNQSRPPFLVLIIENQAVAQQQSDYRIEYS